MEDSVVLYPSAGRGHLVPMVELAKQILTHHPSFSITIVISTTPFENVSTGQYLSTVSSTYPSITFLRLPTTALPPNSPPDMPTLTYELTRLNNPNLRQALSTLSKSKHIKGFVIDFFCNFAFEVSASLNIPTYYFLACGATGLAAFLYLPAIHNLTSMSLKDLDEFINVPGLPPILSYNMPTLALDRNRKVYDYFRETAIQMTKSAGLIINTFEALEKRPINAIRDGQCTPGWSVPPVYCIGPLIASDGGSGKDDEDRHECLSWLDSKPSRSVVFLCFGSMGRLSSKQLKEMAVGLEMSGVRFLWVVRPPPQPPGSGEPSLESLMPDGFLERTKDRGLVVRSWAPQFAVLSHESVGGFVTHCGWNSILEAMCAGVPMLAWPLSAEQKVNRAHLLEEIKVALGVTQSREGFVSAEELRQLVTELMESDKGKEVRERVMGMRESAVAARREGGPSLFALANLAHAFKHGC